MTTSWTSVPRARQLADASASVAVARHYEPPEVAWLPPELELGEEPELKPPELEPELRGAGVAELEPEPVELEPSWWS